MKTTAIAFAVTLALLVTLTPAFAQEPGSKKEPFDMKGAIKKVGELLKESEKLLAESLRPGASPDDAAEKVAATKKAMDELLGQSHENGEAATDLMSDIVKNAPRRQGGSGGGQDQHQKSDPKSKDKPGEEDEVDKKDPKNSKDGDPEGKEKSTPEEKDDPKTGKQKPKSATDQPSDPDLAKEWLATLPPEVRKNFENRNWDEIPPKWREIIRKYMKELADTESE